MLQTAFSAAAVALPDGSPPTVSFLLAPVTAHLQDARCSKDQSDNADSRSLQLNEEDEEEGKEEKEGNEEYEEDDNWGPG